MTISINNSTYDNCPICGDKYTVDPRTDIQKVVELSCHHFFHIECISSWFSNREGTGQDLTCGYCTQFCIPKRKVRNYFTEKDLCDFFAKTKQDAVSISNDDLIGCIENLEPHIASLLNLLNNDMIFINNAATATKNRNKLDNWVITNIQRKFQPTAFNLIRELHLGGPVVITLKDQVQSLASTPSIQWPTEVEKTGFSVVHSADGKKLRMRLSKEHMEREVISYLSERIKNSAVFEIHLDSINGFLRK